MMLRAVLLLIAIASSSAQPAPLTLISFSDGDNGYNW
jgi:hypothetical protein